MRCRGRPRDRQGEGEGGRDGLRAALGRASSALAMRLHACCPTTRRGLGVRARVLTPLSSLLAANAGLHPGRPENNRQPAGAARSGGAA